MTSAASKAAPRSSSFVVLKFGGTSVSSVTNWQNIAGVLRECMAEGLTPMVVHSALSGITDRLEQLLGHASSVAGNREWQATMEHIEQRHRQLASELKITISRELEEQ